MSRTLVSPSKIFRGNPRVPGDKSMSHRALIFGALAHGPSEIINILDGGDVHSTANCLRKLGVEIQTEQDTHGTKTRVKGLGLENFKTPTESLDCGNSGTTMRLLMGLLSASQVSVEMTGDDSLVRRPMKRVAAPLQQMGAEIQLFNDNFAPFRISGRKLKGIDFDLKVASAQIKSAVIIAGLFSEGDTRIRGAIASRDHTERLLGHYGIKLRCSSQEIIVSGGQQFSPCTLQIPADPSSAAFWIAAACLIPNSKIRLDNVSLNPTRMGFIRVLQKIGAQITVHEINSGHEPSGTLEISYAKLDPFHIESYDIPSLIDEIPLLAVIATQIQGTSTVRGAQELRIKESDRLEAIAINLNAMGASLCLREDGFDIDGAQKLFGAEIQSFADHRIAMAFSIAALIADGDTFINDSDCVAISNPDFFKTLRTLCEQS